MKLRDARGCLDTALFVVFLLTVIGLVMLALHTL